jgi:polysaccharide export outer membrane protein
MYEVTFYFYLQPNDYIYIKPLKQKTWGTGKRV